MDADANANLEKTDPGYLDTREGTFYYDITQTCALEIVRLWDALGSETVAAAFPSVAWGDYLDEHAATFGLVRNPAQAATGFVGVYLPIGGVVATGTIFAAAPSDPSLATIEFSSTASATSAAWDGPPSPTVVATQTGGSLAAGTYYYHVTGVNEYGETNGSADQSGVITTATGVNTITWNMLGRTVDSYNVYRATTANTLGLLVATVTPSAADLEGLVDQTFVDDGTFPLQPQVEPALNGTILALCPVTALVAGVAGNLSAGAITEIETVVTGATNVTNFVSTTGGSDAEDDESLRARILAQYTGQGSGTISNYVQLGLSQPDVERVTVIPLWEGPGTVLMIVYQEDGTPVSSDVVTAMQAFIDPEPGLGHGQAPIGATVTVATSAPLSVNIVAVISQRDGYSLLGTGGTIPTQAAILNQITDYLSGLNPGDTIIYQQVESAFFVEGVQELTTLTINGVTTDIALGVSPAQTALLGSTTFS